MQVLLATGEGNLVFLEIAEGQLLEKSHSKLSTDVSCLAINPLEPGTGGSSLAAVGTWSNAVLILQIPSLATVREEQSGGDVIPRSLLFASFEGVSFLLIALGMQFPPILTAAVWMFTEGLPCRIAIFQPFDADNESPSRCKF